MTGITVTYNATCAIEIAANGATGAGATGTAPFVIITLGVYFVEFSASTLEPSQVTIYQNGAPVAGSTYASGSGTQQNSGFVYITAAAGDLITLRNYTSSSAATLQTLAGGTVANANASMSILLVG